MNFSDKSLWFAGFAGGVLVIAFAAVWVMSNPVAELYPPSMIEESAQEESSQKKTYVSDYGFNFTYPATLAVEQANGIEIETAWGSDTLSLPPGSVGVAGELYISTVPLSEISKEKPFVSYISCCAGTKTWYDSELNKWQVQTFGMEPTANGSTVVDSEPAKTCSLDRRIGAHTYYALLGWDEGFPEFYYYHLLTDQGYAVRVASPYDIEKNYSDYPEELRPTPEALQFIKELLSSVTLTRGFEINPDCL